ncbi:helix-turn-helix domain-containing protein [Streptomyces sp. NPDC048383]|uniref:helix-turn-helix transcriptional regulator n=1 Tax=Streptomyces sp. NPDC048383 TaxID=3155386 RepID=UPI00342E97B4
MRGLTKPEGRCEAAGHQGAGLWSFTQAPECHVTPQFMDVKSTATYLNMSVQWVYREAPRLGLTPYKFGAGRNAKIQFKVSDVQAWVKQQRLSS